MNYTLFLIRRLLLSFCLSFIVYFNAVTQTQKFANTLLWEISGNGLTQPSYLFGTMHVSNKMAFHLQDSFFIALSGVDRVSLELNPENWLKDMVESKVYNEMQNMAMYKSINEQNIYQRLINIPFPKPMNYKLALSDNNQIINQLLYRMTNNPLMNNYEEDTYLDLYIYQTAKKLNKQVTGLEKFDESMKMLIKSMIPDDNVQNSMENNSYMDALNMEEKLEKAYRKGNLNELDSLNKISNPSGNFHKYLIIERNKTMVKGMDSLMKLGSLFTGVGAAHLPGKEGLLNLLIAKGYHVKPILGSETSLGKKIKDKLDSKIYKNTCEVHFIKDSSLQYMLPGKLVDIELGSVWGTSIYPDMANGAYYSFTRIPHFASLINKNENYINEQLDSILYESVPGKILTRKKITSNTGFQGYSLVSKLNSGRFMQFQIYFTPLEVLIVKAGGPERAFKSEEWTNFFKTLTFTSKYIGNSWNILHSPKSDFTVNMPGNQALFASLKDENKEVQALSFDKTDSSFYMVSASTLDDFGYLEDDTFEYNYIGENFANEIQADIIKRHTINSRFGAIPEMLYLTKKLKLKSQIILDKYRYYFLVTAGTDTSNWKTFFNSFEIPKNKLTGNYPLIDSALQFKTITDYKPDNEMYSFMESVKKLTPKSLQIDEYMKLSDLFEKVYYSKEYTGKILVSKKSLDRYAQYETADSLWKEVKNELNIKIDKEHRSYIVEPQIIIEEKNPIPSEHIKYFVIRDSFTKNCILIKKVLKNDHVFTISTISDTLNELDPWQKAFIEHFEPWDTCKSFSLSKPKDSIFLANLHSNDSASFASLINYALYPEIVSKRPSIKDSIIQFIASENFNKKTNSEKIIVVELLHRASLKNDQEFKILDKIYNSETENPKIQLSLLQVMIMQHSPKAMEYIKKWLLNNPPLPEDSYEINTLFSTLSDSLDLSKTLFPEILKLTHYSEYKPRIVELLAQLISENKIQSGLWLNEKEYLLRDGKIELKRYNSENISNKENDETEYGYVYDYQKITSELPWEDSKGPNELAAYTVIFSSIYNSDNQAQQFIDKVAKTGHRGLIFSIAITKHHTKQIVNDTIWNWLAADNNSRMHFYDWLEMTNDTNLYPLKYYNQKDMCLSWLMEAHTTQNKDSIQLIEKRFVANVNESGYIYFYKYKVKNQWLLNYVGMQPADTTKMLSDFMYSDNNGIPITGKSQEDIYKKIGEICKDIRYRGRKRVPTGESSNMFEQEEFIN